MSLRITGQGIFKDGNIVIQSESGDVQMQDAILDLPKKSSTKMGGDKVISVGTDEEVICSKLKMEDACCLHITENGYMRMV